EMRRLVTDLYRCLPAEAIFHQALDEEPAPESLPGHPVFTFRMENEVTQRLLEAMRGTFEKWQTGDQEALDSLRQQTENLAAIEKHYSRKENLLFPYLEKKGFEGPSAVMWGVDNEIRSKIKQFRASINASNPDPDKASSQLTQLTQDILEMIYKEEKILFPEALERLSDAEWAEIRQQEGEIGYFNVTPRMAHQPPSQQDTQPIRPVEKEEKLDHADVLPLDTGVLTMDQINLMLTHLPVDITFVDENDEVRYFSHGKERIFDRSPAIIGRAVTKCHPPQSVHKVEIILDDFRKGKRDVAEFWIQMGNKFVHIRYFALHDDQGAYRGCIEVSQEVSHIRKLQGEKRLLDDSPDYSK
ncbi:MAG: DUF438 domain-containing protein, partial [Anaerolineales bacterium]